MEKNLKTWNFEDCWRKFHFCRREIHYITFASAKKWRREIIWVIRTVAVGMRMGVFAWSFHSSALNKNFQHSSCKNLLMDTKPRVNLILFFYSSFWEEPGLPFVRHFNINFEKKISYVILWQTESIISGKFHIWLNEY